MENNINIFKHFISVWIGLALFIILFLSGGLFILYFGALVIFGVLFLIDLKRAFKKTGKKLYLYLFRFGYYSASLLILLFIIVEAYVIYNMKNLDTFEDEEIDAVIVLGAGLHGEHIPLTLRYRLDEALKFLEKNEGVPVVVSGGQGPGEDITEAEAMRRYLEERGIDPARIYKEDKSTSTIENIKFSKKVIKEDVQLKNPTVLIITNEFHTVRALMISKEFDLKAYAIGTESYMLWHYLTREAFALVDTYIKLKTTY
ncbi:hypothetical protein CIB95_08825 [Lottiidibacillus patelloidae]|uniref:DUF218 domain-containing protein n=1 Tax=Lottiidibacillus patelloidae TaxID=2670334 RepID=A0A263BT28_9BACI|nr:YdcF family protein [Lottiidibacillus patelloidae]OZM56864.1 hypothetical protein CIB95_08825 [Lottiidibacillus patelloidae]